MEREILRLFKGFIGEKSDSINSKGLKYGLLIPDGASSIIVDSAIELYGKDGLKLNQTFHKDFATVRNMSIENLAFQQIMHYITTYGLESIGFYQEDLVYIPKEKLDVLELDVDNIELIPIKPFTFLELSNKLMTLLTSGIALSEQTVKDIMVLSDFIDKDKFDDIVNREIKTSLYDKYNIMPNDPSEFLRFLLFKLTNNTLKIQNRDTFNALKKSDKSVALKMLESYLGANGYEKLSSIFLRNKNLFLALKVRDSECKNKEDKEIKFKINAIINKLRKMAVKNHKPLKKNILDCLTDYNEDIDLSKIAGALDGVTIFREVRILNGVLYRLYGNNNIVYKIRNGKSYVTELEPKTPEYIVRLKNIEKMVREHLINRLSLNVKDKVIYIPDNVIYAIPSSEKQFNGNIPLGSCIEIPRLDDLVYGIHWENLYNEDSNSFERVDLDLKQMNKSALFGWDASYKSDDNNILFSGDVTDAPLPNGASELFYVESNYGYGAFLVTLNIFTDNSNDIDFDFVIAKSCANSLQFSQGDR